MKGVVVLATVQVVAAITCTSTDVYASIEAHLNCGHIVDATEQANCVQIRAKDIMTPTCLTCTEQHPQEVTAKCFKDGNGKVCSTQDQGAFDKIAQCEATNVQKCENGKFQQSLNFCNEWCNNKEMWGTCGYGTLAAEDERNSDPNKKPYTCSCSGCNGCSSAIPSSKPCQSEQFRKLTDDCLLCLGYHGAKSGPCKVNFLTFSGEVTVTPANGAFLSLLTVLAVW